MHFNVKKNKNKIKQNQMLFNINLLTINLHNPYVCINYTDFYANNSKRVHKKNKTELILCKYKIKDHSCVNRRVKVICRGLILTEK